MRASLSAATDAAAINGSLESRPSSSRNSTINKVINMFWNASAIKGYAIAATDGDVGHVADIMIDSVNWTVRWLIVDTGSWLNQRTVGLPVWALSRPDPEAHDLAVTLTRRQIESSPEIDEDRLLSLEQEVLMSAHYASVSRSEPKPIQGLVTTLVRTDPVIVEGSRNLVSLNALKNASVEASDGEIGHVESLIVDPETWTIKYLVVHSGFFGAAKKVLILPSTVVHIDDIRGSIDLNVSREKVRGSPDYVALDTIDGAFDETFHIYYGVKWMKK